MNNHQIIKQIRLIKNEILHILITKKESTYQSDIEKVEHLRLKVKELLIDAKQDDRLSSITNAFFSASSSLIQNIKNDLIFQTDPENVSSEFIKEHVKSITKTSDDMIKFVSSF